MFVKGISETTSLEYSLRHLWKMGKFLLNSLRKKSNVFIWWLQEIEVKSKWINKSQEVPVQTEINDIKIMCGLNKLFF